MGSVTLDPNPPTYTPSYPSKPPPPSSPSVAYLTRLHHSHLTTSTSPSTSPCPSTTISSLLSSLTNPLTTLLPPNTRNHLKHTATYYTSKHPHLSALALLLLFFCGPPILLFTLTTTLVTLFAVTTGVVLGLLGAMWVIAFTVGLGLVVVVPVVCMGGMVAVGCWVGGCLGWWAWEVVRGEEVGRDGGMYSGQGDGVERTKKAEGDSGRGWVEDFKGEREEGVVAGGNAAS